MKSSFEQELKDFGRIVYTNSGKSMYPLIREHRDLLVIEPVNQLKMDDCILFKSRSGGYVLHRIVKVTKDGCVTRGDNCWRDDQPIKQNQVLGHLVRIIRDKKDVPLSGIKYWFYVHLICKCRFFKFFAMGFRRVFT